MKILVLILFVGLSSFSFADSVPVEGGLLELNQSESRVNFLKVDSEGNTISSDTIFETSDLKLEDLFIFRNQIFVIKKRALGYSFGQIRLDTYVIGKNGYLIKPSARINRAAIKYYDEAMDRVWN